MHTNKKTNYSRTNTTNHIVILVMCELDTRRAVWVLLWDQSNDAWKRACYDLRQCEK